MMNKVIIIEGIVHLPVRSLLAANIKEFYEEASGDLPKVSIGGIRVFELLKAPSNVTTKEYVHLLYKFVADNPQYLVDSGDLEKVKELALT